MTSFALRTIRRGLAALGVDEISTSQLPDAARKRMRRQQIRGAIEQMRVFVIGNTVFAPVLAYQAWDTGMNAVAFLWTAIMLSFSWWLFFNWRTSYHTDGNLRDMDRFVAETRVNAAIWCMGMVLFYPVVEGDNKAIVCTIMAGSLALGTVGFAQAPRAAFWYLGIQTTTLTSVAVINGIMTSATADITIGVLALVAGLAIFNATLERGKIQMRAFINHEQLVQKSEVIDLLLKDYEEQGDEWLWQTNRDGYLTLGPRQVLDLSGLNIEDENPVRFIDALAQNMDARGTSDLARLRTAFESQTDLYNVTLPFQDDAQGHPTWIMMRGRPQFDADGFCGFRGIFADATTTVEAKKRIEYLADHDPLTGLANRNVVKRRLEALSVEVDKLSAILIDLDGFKQVNDSYGHSIGDRLLEVVSKRLNSVVPPEGLVARLGGDEFLILIDQTNTANASSLTTFTNALLTTLSQPYLIDNYDIVLSASIGSANYPHDTTIGPTLLIQADLALYAAKQNGRNQTCAFVGEMQTGLQKRMIVTERLKTAIGAGEIRPFYQPQYCAKTHRLVGFEALARWNDARLGAVGPDIFIPIAEETGLIHDLGAHLLRQACLDAMAWPALDGGPAPLLSVNLSPAQVTRGDIVQRIKDILEETQLPPTRLEIEITEGVLIHDMNTTCEVLQDLSYLGVKIALDDFGTGYSSLSYLHALPLDRLKIDRAFVADLDDPVARPIVQTIIDLCRTLNLSVIAEGVETTAQVNTLQAMRCDILQGYYFAPALSAEAALSLLDYEKAPRQIVN